jgi:hypothetical protein
VEGEPLFLFRGGDNLGRILVDLPLALQVPEQGADRGELPPYGTLGVPLVQSGEVVPDGEVVDPIGRRIVVGA